MTDRCFVAAACLAMLGWAASGQAQTPPRPGAPVVHASIDRTALWVGDRVTYTIEFVCPRGTDVLEDDLAKDKLRLDGLDIVSTETARTEGADQSVTRRFTYVLTTYKVNVASLRVAPFSVRYYATRPGQRLQESAPAGEVQVPGAVVALRSTLPEDQEPLALRDGRAPEPRRAAYALAQPVGIGLVVVSIAPAVFWAIAFAARRRQRVRGRSVRQARKDERASIEAARAIDVSGPQGRRDAYTQIEAIVRHHIGQLAGMTGESLTPQEVEPALAGHRTRVPAEEIGALLAECERARYGPLEALPTAEACREAVGRAAQLVSGRG